MKSSICLIYFNSSFRIYEKMISTNKQVIVDTVVLEANIINFLHKNSEFLEGEEIKAIRQAQQIIANFIGKMILMENK